MRLACWRAGKLLAARRSGLGEPDRLWLDDHLGGCARCHADELALSAITRVVLSEDAAAPRKGARVDRAIAAALAAPPAAPAARRPLLVWPVLGLAVAAAALVFWLQRPSTMPTVAEPEKPTPLAPVRPALAPQPLVDGHYQLAHAEIDLSDGADGTWMPEAREVVLRSGKLRAHVDKEKHERFSVITPQFVVEVIGTRFEVAGDSVTVEEGVVRVLSVDGRVLAAEVGAGGRWSLAPVPVKPETPSTRAEVDLGRELSAARKKLAARDVDAARRHLDRVTSGKPSRVQLAEAETLSAEIHLVEGRKLEAAQQYLKVAERYADLPAGENALWAAASLRIRLGERGPARALAERYLRAYPRGRFQAEARALVDH